MSDTPEVSVVIPCYRHAHFLPETLDSVLGYSPAAEILVVDDGSPGDDVERVVDGYPEVGYLRRPHRGVSATRNAGLEASRGRYVLFLDSDDRLLPGAIEAHLSCLRDHPDVGFVFGRLRYIKEDGRPAGEPGVVPPTHPTYEDLVRENFIGMLGNVLFRREAVVTTGGFRTDLSYGEDYELLLRVARERGMAAHERVVVEYRRYRTSASADAARMLEGVSRVLDLEEARADATPAVRRAFAEGRRFFTMFYAVRLVRQIVREGILKANFGQATRWMRLLIARLRWSQLFLRLPVAVAVAAVRKAGWIFRGWWDDRVGAAHASSVSPGWKYQDRRKSSNE